MATAARAPAALPLSLFALLAGGAVAEGALAEPADVSVGEPESVADEPSSEVGGGAPGTPYPGAAGAEEALAAAEAEDAEEPALALAGELAAKALAADWNSAKVFVGGALIAKTIPCWQ
jgi:hypothetical protein